MHLARVGVQPSGNLHIAEVRHSDEGVYQCVAVNSVSSAVTFSPQTTTLLVRSMSVIDVTRASRPGFFIGGGQDGRVEGRERECGFWGGATTPSPPARISGGALPLKGFPLFSALRMAFPDTIILLLVDYHATVELSV